VRSVARRRVEWVPASVVWSEDAAAVLASDADVVVELAGGLDPAGGWVRAALGAGKSVVTANKKLIAYHGAELERLAAAHGGHLRYGAAVAGGIPVIPGLEQGLAGDRIERIEGILNGTCNFILSRMQEGAEYATVLVAAQAKGYAEADPTEDVGGFDARAKLAILMRLALGVEVDPEEIAPQPITRITVALAGERINIRAIFQRPGYPQHALPFEVTVEPCESSALRRALVSIRGKVSCSTSRWICRCWSSGTAGLRNRSNL
jgi:homoserine dehydrogenase